MLRFIGMYLQVRLEKHILLKDSKKKAHERQDTVDMMKRILMMKTYKSLIIGIQKELTPFFGFKELGVLFYDREKDKFFTL